jgi:DNA-binding NarL/FixJ family response regulator
MNIISVGILEDDEAMRGFLITIIKQTDDMKVGFAADTVESAKAQARAIKVDICLVDLQLPDGYGLDFIADLKTHTDAKLLILTVLGDKVSVLSALQSGANGYLLKDTRPDQLRKSIRATMAGENPISPAAATHLLNLFKEQSQSQSEAALVTSDENLTAREVDILTMFSRGLSYKETADTLNISNHTVGDHVKSIYKKLSVHSRSEAIFEAVQSGWIKI